MKNGTRECYRSKINPHHTFIHLHSLCKTSNLISSRNRCVWIHRSNHRRVIRGSWPRNRFRSAGNRLFQKIVYGSRSGSSWQWFRRKISVLFLLVFDKFIIVDFRYNLRFRFDDIIVFFIVYWNEFRFRDASRYFRNKRAYYRWFLFDRRFFFFVFLS